MLKKLFQKKSQEGQVPAVESEPPIAEEAIEEVQAAPEPEPEPEPEEEKAIKKGFFQGAWEATKKLALTPVDPWFEAVAKGLDRTRQGLVQQMVALFSLHKKIDQDFWEELEDILVSSDVGTAASDRIIDRLREIVKEKKLTSPEGLFDELKMVMTEILVGDSEPQVVDNDADALDIQPGRLNVILMVGVNGTGKTTTTAKLTHRFRQRGLKVLLAAADTFRAAAIEQLEVWGQRLGVDVIRHNEGSDPAAVVFDAISSAKARKVDVLIVDTAGRLHSKVNLMEELKKIRRVLERENPGAPHEVLLVLDATTGQNGLAQARVFNEICKLSGLVLCKLDGTAKGGIVVAIAQEFSIPVKFIGVGEAIDDLRPFHSRPFLGALFGEEPEAATPAGGTPAKS